MKLSTILGLSAAMSAMTLSNAALLVDNTGASDILAGLQFGNSNSAADDGYTGSRGIGFTFPFYGSNKISIFHNANGLTAFGAFSSSSSYFTNSAITASPVTPTERLAPFWDDLRPQFDNSQSAPKSQGFEQKTISGIYAFSMVKNRMRISGGSDSSNTISYQVALFGVDMTYAGFDFKAGDIAFSYADLLKPATGDVTIGVGKSSTQNTPIPGDSDGLVSYLGSALPNVLPTGNNFILFRYNTLLSNTGGQYVASIQSTVVPEPTSAGLVAAAGVAFASRRRRA